MFNMVPKGMVNAKTYSQSKVNRREQKLLHVI